jgi:hypothetical protein
LVAFHIRAAGGVACQRPHGHQYLATPEPAQKREQLISLVLDLWQGTTVDRTQATWRAKRPDGKVLHVALSPESEYDRAIRNLGAEGIHYFGDGSSGYLWRAAPGMVRIDLNGARDSLILSQVEFADDDEDARRAINHALAADWPHGLTTLRYEVTSGPVVVAWSPNSARDVSTPIGQNDTAPSLPGMLLDLAIGASGALLWLEPGMYASTLQYHEGGSWAVSCCRFQRVPPA